MHFIDGKKRAEKIRAEVKQEITQKQITPHLAVLLVGDDPASHLYVSLKEKAAQEVGVQITIDHRRADVTDDELVRQIQSWNENASIHGILVQLPLPEGHDTERIIAAVDPNKDVDGFRVGSPVASPTHEAILRLINETPLKLSGASATLIVNSDTFAAPLKHLLEVGGVSVDIMKPDELDRDLLAEADAIIVAVGRPNFLHANMTKPNTVIIDVGTNKTNDGKTVGDVDQESFTKTNVWLTPVPGGVGPMTVALLMKNVMHLALLAKTP